MTEPQRLYLTNTPPPADTTKTPTPRKTNKNQSRLPPLDWAASHGPITGAVSATTGAYATALLGTATGMPDTLPLLIGTAGALGHGIGHSVFRRLTARTGVTRAASWLLAGGWTTWAMTTGPLTWVAAGTLTGIGVGIGAMASNAAMHEEVAEDERLTAEARQLAQELDAGRRAIANEWHDRLLRVTRLDVKVFAVEQWKNGAGYSIAGELPGAAVWTTIRDKHRALAADARLPRGCTVHVEEGDIQGRVVIDVTTVNIMGDIVDYPTDYTPLSILTGIPWGSQPNSQPVTVYLREACALVLGPPGSGKSTFLDGIIAGFARCVDVVTWVIDLKAGAVGRPWARPWLESAGHVKPTAGMDRAPEGTRPGVDWIASTPAEALLMMRVVLAINAARQHHYQDLMDAANTTLLPVSRTIPQIEVVIDEGAELLSAATHGDPVMKELQAAVKKTMRTTRAMGERLVLTAIDGNVSAIGNTEVRKFSPVGAALTSGESVTSNISKLFSAVRVDTSQLNEKGAGVIGQAGADGFEPTPFKTWRTSPNMVRDVVLATNNIRPHLDQASATAGGDIYAQRWTPERAGWLWGAPEYTDPEPGAAPTLPAQTTVQQPQAPRTTRTPQEPGGGLNLSYKRRQQPLPDEDPDQLAARLMEQIDQEYGTTDEPDTSGLNLSYKRTQPEDRTDPRLAFARNLIRAAGPDGLDTRDLWPALTQEFGPEGWDRTVVTNWLSKDVTAGRLHRKAKGIYGHGPQPEAAGEQETAEETELSELLPTAIDLIVAKQRASAQFLQRNLRIGWELTQALLGALEGEGVIGAAQEDGSHPVLRQPDN
ncbi:DNA translocase FtsK [[Kitasatospora] papulosa]|uniref:DNA translocase FtsK n=1 Tax=[Kitasatospora] papulosa TaxID=1464011 RepID=UPI003857D593